MTRDRDDRLQYVKEVNADGEVEAPEDEDENNADCIANIERQIEEHMLQMQDEIADEDKEFVQKELRL